MSLNSLALFDDSTVVSSGRVHADAGDPIAGSVRNILRVAPLFMCCVLLFLSLHQQGWKWVRTYPKGVVGVEMRGREPCFWTRSQEGFEPILVISAEGSEGVPSWTDVFSKDWASL